MKGVLVLFLFLTFFGQGTVSENIHNNNLQANVLSNYSSSLNNNELLPRIYAQDLVEFDDLNKRPHIPEDQILSSNSRENQYIDNRLQSMFEEIKELNNTSIEKDKNDPVLRNMEVVIQSVKDQSSNLDPQKKEELARLMIKLQKQFQNYSKSLSEIDK